MTEVNPAGAEFVVGCVVGAALGHLYLPRALQVVSPAFESKAPNGWNSTRYFSHLATRLSSVGDARCDVMGN